MSPSNQRRFTPNAQANGFTLVELIVVIIILGILSATALPKFITLGQDARLKLVDATESAIITASHQAFAMCLLQPRCNSSSVHSTPFTAPNGVSGVLVRGFPTGQSRPASFMGIKDWVDIGGDITVTEVDPRTSDFKVESAPDSENCKVRYKEATTFGLLPTITPFTSGC